MKRSPQIQIKEYMKDKLVRDISVIWKVLHLCGFLSSCVIGFIAFMLMKQVSLIFEHECILYSDLEIEFISPTNWTILIEGSSWGRKFYCEIPQIVSVFSFIYGFVLLVFFSMCGSGARGITNKLSPPKNIVVPGLIFCFIFTCISIYCSIHVQFGYHMFCLNLKNNVLDSSSNLYVWEYFLMRCAYNENLSNGGKSIGRDLLFLDIGCIFILLQCLSWAFNTFLLLLRCCCVADFRLIVMVTAKYSSAVDFDLSVVENLTKIILPSAQDIPDATYRTDRNSDFAKSVRKSIMSQMHVDNTESGSSKSKRLPICQESTIKIINTDSVDSETYKLNQNELSGGVKKTIINQMTSIQQGSLLTSPPQLKKIGFTISQTESGNTDTKTVKNNKPNEKELLNFTNDTEKSTIGQCGQTKYSTIESSSQQENAVNKIQEVFPDTDNSLIRNIISQMELPHTVSGVLRLSRQEEKAVTITQTKSGTRHTTSVNNEQNENKLLNVVNSTESSMMSQYGQMKSGTIESSSQEENVVN